MKRHLVIPAVRRLLSFALSALAAIAAAGAQGIAPEPGTGALWAERLGGRVALPLVAMDVDLSVTGAMLRGVVTQEFVNTLEAPVNVTYTFPLPDRAAVDAMELRVGTRVIVAEIRERAQARAEYEQAKSEGKKASLVERQRPNLFSTHAANIAPGERLAVRLEYLEELRPVDGRFTLVFPLTYTPRYTSPSAEAAASESRPAPPAAPAADGGPWVRADDPVAPRARLRVRLDAGAPLADVRSSSHAVMTGADGGARLVELAESGILLDRDFTLSWRLALAPEPGGALLIEERPEGRYGTLIILPPQDGAEMAAGLPTETLFIIDTSGSMDGPSIEQARRALAAALARLRPGDSFELIRYASDFSLYSEEIQAVSHAAVADAQRWVAGLEASGGTEILPALRRGVELLAASRSQREQRIVVITDGAVAYEDQVLALVAEKLGRTRLHTVGIGHAPNRWLMRKLAELGRGGCTFIGGVEEVGPLMNEFLERIDRPVLADITLDWEGAAPAEVYPETLPDLYAGEPLLVSVRFPGGAVPTAVTIGGRAHGGMASHRTPVRAAPDPRSGVGARWARAKVESLMDSLIEGVPEEEVRREVIATALPFSLVTRYTSLVAVEKTPTVARPGVDVDAANSLPEGAFMPQTATLHPLLTLIGLALAVAGSAGWLVLGPRSAG